MQGQLTTQLLGVIGRQTKRGQAVWDAQVAQAQLPGDTSGKFQGKFSTFDANMAGKASQFANQMVTISYEIKQNGQYTNYDLVDIGPAGAMPPQVQGATAAPPVNGGQQYTPPPVTQAAPAQGGYTPEVVTRITKLATLEIASQFVGSLLQGKADELNDEVVEKSVTFIEQIAKRLYIAARSHETPTVAEGPATPAAVAEAVNAVQPDAVAVGPPPTPQEPAENDVKWE
jgi:hypothetical protein